MGEILSWNFSVCFIEPKVTPKLTIYRVKSKGYFWVPCWSKIQKCRPPEPSEKNLIVYQPRVILKSFDVLWIKSWLIKQNAKLEDFSAYTLATELPQSFPEIIAIVYGQYTNHVDSWRELAKWPFYYIHKPYFVKVSTYWGLGKGVKIHQQL